MSEIVWKEVFSENVKEIGYSDDTKELFVKWSGGSSGVYSGVPAEIADEVSKSWSVKTALTNTVIGRYPYRRG